MSKISQSMLILLGMGVAAVLIASLLSGYEHPKMVEKANNTIATLSEDIREFVKTNDIHAGSKITGTAGELPAEGQIVDSETKESYFFALPTVSTTKLGSDPSYISLTGTVDEYIIKYSDPSYSILAEYNSRTGSTVFEETQH